MAPSFQRIDHVHVFVADRVAAEAWYERVLGLRRIAELAFWSADGGPLTLGNLGSAVDGVHLALFEGTNNSRCSTVALGVPGAELLAWRTHLQDALGRRIDLVDHQVSMSMYFADPDGNPFEITSNDHAVVSALLRETGASAP